jgi:hypothetical protein
MQKDEVGDSMTTSERFKALAMANGGYVEGDL